MPKPLKGAEFVQREEAADRESFWRLALLGGPSRRQAWPARPRWPSLLVSLDRAAKGRRADTARPSKPCRALPPPRRPTSPERRFRSCQRPDPTPFGSPEWCFRVIGSERRDDQ